jgi:hypothetical protein
MICRVLLFPEKEAKSVVSASQKTVGYPTLGEADPGGLGACPQGNQPFGLSTGPNLFSFSRKSINTAVRHNLWQYFVYIRSFCYRSDPTKRTIVSATAPATSPATTPAPATNPTSYCPG